MLKIGVFGVGHLGKIHLKCIQLAKDYFDLLGFFDPDDATAKAVEEQFGLERFTSSDDLIAAVDVVDIVTPTRTHFALAKRAVLFRKHFFIEKPVTYTPEESEELMHLVAKAGLKAQVGHVERFNPALLALGEMEVNPMFIEGHRLAGFNPRGADVSVILDLMIHDLDIVLSLVKSELKSVYASGVSVVSSSTDIANARLEFENGCVANLTASRISLKQMRKLRLFQKDSYVSLDFLEKKAQVVRIFEKNSDGMPAVGSTFSIPTPGGEKLILVENPAIEPVNAIRLELESFAESILTNKPTRVPLEDGYRALHVAYRILQQISKAGI
jgi:predicted dehydrogenase